MNGFVGATADWPSDDAEERVAIQAEATHANSGSGRWRLLTDVELEQQPPRSDLVAETLPTGGLSAVVGPPASAKTTLLLDLAFSIARGQPWQGCAVAQGPVVIVAAEGSGGLGPRIRAWKRAHDVGESCPVYFLPRAVSVMNPIEVDAFLVAVKALKPSPVLIAFDTLARCLVGGEENSARDVGLWIAGADRIRHEVGAAVIALHHTTKTATTERGSGALRGAVDTLIFVEREDDVISIKCEKQKDSAPFPVRRLRLDVVFLDGGQSACVLRSADVTAYRKEPPTLPETRRRALDALRDLDHGDGAAAGEWQRASGLSERTFHRAVKDLQIWCKVRQEGSRRAVRYTVVPDDGAADAF